MDKFIPREKLSKKARKKLDAEKRATWSFSPVTKKIDSKKLYNRKRNPMTVLIVTVVGFLFVLGKSVSNISEATSVKPTLPH